MDAAEGLAPRLNRARAAPEGADGDGIDAHLPAQSTITIAHSSHAHHSPQMAAGLR
jgi:hypothetical protein